jgi:hypothetical protein
VKNAEGKEAVWTIDLKKAGTVTKGPATKSDVSISLSDGEYSGIHSQVLSF